MTKESASPSFPEPVLSVRAWADPVLDQLGHDPRSTYVEQYWVPVLGPSSYLLLRRLVALLDASDEGGTFVAAEWAVELGLGVRGGKHGPFWRSIDRLARFGILHRSGSAITVRRKLAPLNQRQIGRLAPHLQLRHNEWETKQRAEPRRPTVAVYQPKYVSPEAFDIETEHGVAS